MKDSFCHFVFFHNITNPKIINRLFYFFLLLRFNVMASRIKFLRAVLFNSSHKWISIARLILPSRLELKSPAGSLSNAPLANVNLILSLYVSPVQIIPLQDHAGTPIIEFDGFLRFTSSTIFWLISLMIRRNSSRILPRQSPNSFIFFLSIIIAV